ncbi:hypothetical protein [Streptomyces sp. NPDC048436]|uniref:hypothetical protein n=1 Tax=Streptomyces sp. NPDC048436 TaxID=3365550 RepID=UPI003724285D
MSSEGERPDGGSEERDSFEGDGLEEDRSIHIGSVSGGAFAIGDHNSVVELASTGTQNPTALELLSAMRELRTDLATLLATDGLRAFGVALADAEEEIARHGGTSLSRLYRLREDLAGEQALLGGLASAGAVAALLDDAMQDHPSWATPPPAPSSPPFGGPPAGPGWAAPAGHTPPGPSPGSDDDEWPETDG